MAFVCCLLSDSGREQRLRECRSVQRRALEDDKNAGGAAQGGDQMDGEAGGNLGVRGHSTGWVSVVTSIKWPESSSQGGREALLMSAVAAVAQLAWQVLPFRNH